MRMAPPWTSATRRASVSPRPKPLRPSPPGRARRVAAVERIEHALAIAAGIPGAFVAHRQGHAVAFARGLERDRRRAVFRRVLDQVPERALSSAGSATMTPRHGLDGERQAPGGTGSARRARRAARKHRAPSPAARAGSPVASSREASARRRSGARARRDRAHVAPPRERRRRRRRQAAPAPAACAPAASAARATRWRAAPSDRAPAARCARPSRSRRGVELRGLVDVVLSG